MYLVKEENVLEMSHRPLTLREKETAWLNSLLSQVEAPICIIGKLQGF